MVNSRYTSEVVERVQNPRPSPFVGVRTVGLVVSPAGPSPLSALPVLMTAKHRQSLPVRVDYQHHAGAIPLPATFTIDLGKQLARHARRL